MRRYIYTLRRINASVRGAARLRFLLWSGIIGDAAFRGVPAFMSDTIPVFVDGHCVRIVAGRPALDAVALHDAALAGQLAAGAAYVTDGRGIRLASEAPIQAGAILRVVVTARREPDEADAHP
jgi:hypothetical protein